MKTIYSGSLSEADKRSPYHAFHGVPKEGVTSGVPQRTFPAGKWIPRWQQVVVLLAALGASGPAFGDEEEPPIKLILHPAAEPQPALKYRLLPEFMDRIPGNAAVYYGKVTAEQTVFFGNREWRDKIYRWLETPLDELRREKAHVPLDIYYLRQGARCEYCDWQLPIREESLYRILLPDAQQARFFGRIVCAHARIQIAHGEFDDAVKTLQTGYALARNVAEGETLVNGLVGIAISDSMSQQVTEFVQQPEAPNLYWALTMLPRPLIDMREALEVEMNGIELSFAEVENLEQSIRSPNEWRDLLHRFCDSFHDWLGEPNALGSPEEIAEAIKGGYPRAKQALIEHGQTPESVEAMTIEQVVLLYSIQIYRDLRDDLCKYFHLPYPVAIEGIVASEDRARNRQLEIIPVAEKLLEPIKVVREAIVRHDRRFAVLRVIEALRIYGASHQGKLPKHLSDITEVPIPNDPVTGKPFVYQLEGDTATLRGPLIRDIPLNYEITMRRP